MSRPVEEVWIEVLDRISEHINTPSMRVWFEGTKPVGLYENRLEISVPNPLAKEYIESRFKPLLENALNSTLGREDTTLVVKIEKANARAPQRDNGGNGWGFNGAESGRNLRTPRAFKAKYTFDTFVIGAGNRFAHAAALAVSRRRAWSTIRSSSMVGWAWARRTSYMPSGSTSRTRIRAPGSGT
jgi:chromosomal replication initiator protein